MIVTSYFVPFWSSAQSMLKPSGRWNPWHSRASVSIVSGTSLQYAAQIQPADVSVQSASALWPFTSKIWLTFAAPTMLSALAGADRRLAERVTTQLFATPNPLGVGGATYTQPIKRIAALTAAWLPLTVTPLQVPLTACWAGAGSGAASAAVGKAAARTTTRTASQAVHFLERNMVFSLELAGRGASAHGPSTRDLTKKSCRLSCSQARCLRSKFSCIPARKSAGASRWDDPLLVFLRKESSTSRLLAGRESPFCGASHFQDPSPLWGSGSG